MYLLRSANALFPNARLAPPDVRSTWAGLRPLLAPDKTPEAARLRMNDGYRRQFEEMFKPATTVAREANVRPLGLVTPTMPTLRVRPSLSVEPMLTYYQRRAAGYDFVRGVLESSFGCEGLRSMRRITASGASDATLGDELMQAASLFRGAAAVAAEEIGMARAEESTARQFRTWAKAPDPELAADTEGLAWVGSFGGYADLRNVIVYLTTGVHTFQHHRHAGRVEEYNRWKLAALLTPFVEDERDRERLALIASRRLANPSSDIGALAAALGPSVRSWLASHRSTSCRVSARVCSSSMAPTTTPFPSLRACASPRRPVRPPASSSSRRSTTRARPASGARSTAARPTRRRCCCSSTRCSGHGSRRPP